MHRGNCRAGDFRRYLVEIVDNNSRLRKNHFATCALTSAAKAAAENRAVIAALKRCATPNPTQHRVFPRPARASSSDSPHLLLSPRASITQNERVHMIPFGTSRAAPNVDTTRSNRNEITHHSYGWPGEEENAGLKRV